MKEKDIELLKQIAEVEDSLDPSSLPAKLGWRSRDVGVWPGTLTALRMKGYIEATTVISSPRKLEPCWLVVVSPALPRRPRVKN